MAWRLSRIDPATNIAAKAVLDAFESARRGRRPTIECYRAALALKPHALIYSNLGNAQDELGQIDAAVLSYRRALELGDTAELRVNFARCAKNLDVRNADVGLRALVTRVITEAWTRPSDLASAAMTTPAMVRRTGAGIWARAPTPVFIAFKGRGGRRVR